MEISVRDLHNDMKKSSENGGLAIVADSMTQEVMIRDTPLRYFIPPQFRKMTFRFADMRFASFPRI